MDGKIDFGTLMKRYGIVLILVAECIFFSFGTKNFASLDNVFNILRQTSMLGIVCIGMTLVILTGGIDLSVGTMVGVSLIICAELLVRGVAPVVACIVAVLGSVVVGTINAFLVSNVGITSLIATLGIQTAFRGLIFIQTHATPIFGFDPSFRVLGQGYIFDIIPIPVVIMIGMLVIAWFYLNKTTFGRHTYAVGGNEEVARLSGVNVRKIKYMTYMISGFCSGIAGIILLSRLFSGQPRGGIGLEMDAITAVVLGGVSLAGGQGRLSGVIIGVFIMAVLSNGLIMIGVNDYWQMFLMGIVLIAAVSFDVISNKRKKNRFVKEDDKKAAATL